MADVQIRITNLPQIKSAFNRSPMLMLRELNKAIAKSVLLIGRSSRQNAPVDTGRLRASHYESFGNLKGEVGTNTSYDMFVHEGTRYMTARPYLRQAVERNANVIEQEFTRAVQSTLDQIGRSV